MGKNKKLAQKYFFISLNCTFGLLLLDKFIFQYYYTATSFCPRKDMTEKKSTQKLSQKLVQQLEASLDRIDGWGSVEIIIQDNKVTQITEKNIKKHKIELS